MEELEITLNICIANTFLMYFKAHSYHWNVEGSNFAEAHGFLGDMYEELYGAVDPMAEELRSLGDYYAPLSLAEIQEYGTIEEDTTKPEDFKAMLSNLQDANNKIADSLNKLFDLSTSHKKQGLADFAAGRLDAHAKHGWMLLSYLKG